MENAVTTVLLNLIMPFMMERSHEASGCRVKESELSTRRHISQVTIKCERGFLLRLRERQLACTTVVLEVHYIS